jgi:hypothetical protein
MIRELLTQPAGGQCEGAARGGRVRQGVEHHEFEDGPLEARRRHAHTRSAQLVGVRLPLVTQDVGLAGDDESRREVPQLLGGRLAPDKALR